MKALKSDLAIEIAKRRESAEAAEELEREACALRASIAAGFKAALNQIYIALPGSD